LYCVTRNVSQQNNENRIKLVTFLLN